MRLKRTALTGMLAGALMMPAFAASATDTAADDRLEERIEKNVGKDDKVGHLEIDVNDGVTTIRGEVASVNERARAEKLARAAGAKKVVNLVEIDADKAIARIKERAEVKKDKIEESAERQKDAVDRQTEAASKRAQANEAGANGKRPTSAPVNSAPVTSPGNEPPRKEVFDPLVTAKVKTRIIRDDLLDKSDINVDTDTDGLVTLKGSVPSAAAHARAIELARTTEGVRKVVDQLVVKAPVTK